MLNRFSGRDATINGLLVKFLSSFGIRFVFIERASFHFSMALQMQILEKFVNCYVVQTSLLLSIILCTFSGKVTRTTVSGQR